MTITVSPDYDKQVAELFVRAGSKEISYLEARRLHSELWRIEEQRIVEELAAVGYELNVNSGGGVRSKATICRKVTGRVTERLQATSSGGRELTVLAVLKKFNQAREVVDV